MILSELLAVVPSYLNVVITYKYYRWKRTTLPPVWCEGSIKGKLEEKDFSTAVKEFYKNEVETVDVVENYLYISVGRAIQWSLSL